MLGGLRAYEGGSAREEVLDPALDPNENASLCASSCCVWYLGLSVEC